MLYFQEKPNAPGCSSRSGQALIESVVVIALVSLILFGLVQVSQLYAAREIMEHAAVASARAKTVGLNDFMVFKVTRVSTIPNAGLIVEPDMDSSSASPTYWGSVRPGQAYDDIWIGVPGSPQTGVELSRIPLYLGAEGLSQLPGILDYEDWDSVHNPNIRQITDDLVEVETRQDYPLRFPMHRAYYADDEVQLEGRAVMGAHASLYLE